MVYNDLELTQRSTIKFSQFGSSSQNDVDIDNCFGEIIHDGKLSWLAKGAHLEVFSLKDGQRICSYHFDSHAGFEKSIITTVTEIECANENCCFLAVGLQTSDGVSSIIAIYSVQGSKILRCILIAESITSLVHISEDITKHTFVQLMQGCLAVGTDLGKLILLDINFKKCENALIEEGEDKLGMVPCHMVKSTLDFAHITDHYKHTLQENFNFGIELEQIGGESFVLSLLPIPPALCLIAGLEDGRMIIYDLNELQILYIVLPQEHLSPLSKMTYLQPQDDPRAMIYVWAFHENPESCFAVMHCLEFEKKVVDDNDHIILFEEFQTSHVKLVLTMNEKTSLPIRCQAVTKLPNKEDDDDVISICMLAWKTKSFTQILVFDMNQWYKEEMPEGGDWREHLTYLSPFRVKNAGTFDIYFDKNTVSHFNSVQRIEEHFYPISLTFNFVFLLSNASVGYHWPGLQYRALELLNTAGAMAILDPAPYFNEIKCSSLLPQFYHGEKRKKDVSLSIQREILLSVALEYNCIGLLKSCARTWADGSCIGQNPNEGVSLSTLTEWIWKRAGALKQRCNTLSECLFDYSGRLMDKRSKKELFHLTRQIKILADLLEVVLTSCKQHIPNHIFDRLKSELNSIRMASEYQDVLQWLLNIGLLPESLPVTSDEKSNSILVPYPFKLLNNFYKTQRSKFLEINHDLIKPRTNGCRLLYIDSFIEHKCNIEALKEQWQTERGQAAYPPSSMQTLLRTLLVPDVPVQTKHALFIYAFLDLNMAVLDESYLDIVQNLIKFPAVFKLNASLIKTMQAFWNLDHGQFEVALEEIICPFLHDRKLEQWEQELLVESLLVQENVSLALRALQAHSAPVNPTLELKVYVANDLISEAFHLARSKKSPELMETFVRCCAYVGKLNVLRDLALTEEEEEIIEDFLKESKSSTPENLYLMYMLQKSKYIEAKTYLDDIRSINPTKLNFSTNNSTDSDLSKTLLSAYNCAMTPLSKNLNECYYGLRNKIGFSNQLRNQKNKESLKPFSAELLKDNKRGLNDGLFQSSILCIDSASNYWNEKSASKKREERMMQTNNVGFVRKPQLEAYVDSLSNTDILSYPEVFKEPKKRRLDSEEDFLETSGIAPEDIIQENRKKRMRLMQSNESYSVFTENDRSQIQNQNNSKSSSIPSKDLLNTPIVDSCKFAKSRIKSEKDKILTTQSILKINSLLRPYSPSVLKPVKISESKPIQYEYSESVISSEANESEINENLIESTNLQETLSIEDTLDAYKTARSEQILRSTREELSKIDEEESEIDTNETMLEPKQSSISILSNSNYNPTKGRKSIRSSNTEKTFNINTSAMSVPSVYVSTISQTNIFKEIPQKEMDLDENIENSSILESSISSTSYNVAKEISTDSGAISCKTSDLSPSVKEFARKDSPQIKLMGPKSRQPIRKSATPPKKDDEIKLQSKRIVRSEEISDTDSQVRISDIKNKIELISSTMQLSSLSRLVAEKNLLKNMVSDKNNTRQVEHKEVTEHKSDLYKTSTNEFKPSICSSKVASTVSKFIENIDKNKLSDQTTVVDELSMTETTRVVHQFDTKENVYHEIQEIDPKASLMSTVEVTSTSWIDNSKAIAKSPEKIIHVELEGEARNAPANEEIIQRGIKQCEEMESEEEEEIDEEQIEVEDEEETEEEDDNDDNEIDEEIEDEKSQNIEKTGLGNVIDISSDSSDSSPQATTATSSVSGESESSSKSTASFHVENLKDGYNSEEQEHNIKIVVTRPISLSSSLDSTLEVSNDESDTSKFNQTNVINITIEEEKIADEAINEHNEQNVEIQKDEAVHSPQLNVVNITIEEENIADEALNEHNEQNVQQQKDKAVHSPQRAKGSNIDISVKENTSEIKKQTQDSVFGTTNDVQNTQKKESIDKTKDIVSKETEKVKDNKDHSNDREKLFADENFKNINDRKNRAQSVHPEISGNTSTFNSPKRSTRASSEQPNNDLKTNIKKRTTNLSTYDSPNTIMTRRRSRLLDRIEEENVLETPTKKTPSRKRQNSQDNVSESSFTLNFEPGTPESVTTGKQKRRNSISSNLEDVNLTPSHKVLLTTTHISTPRRASRGSSMTKELHPLEEEVSKPEEVLTPSRRHSRRLSLHKENAAEVVNEEISELPIKKTRRSSTLIENSETNLTPRRTRAGGSLIEMVLTPRRSSRGASLVKELSPSLSEAPESSTKKTPGRRNLRSLSQIETTTPKQLFKGEYSKNDDDDDDDDDEKSEANSSIEKDTVNKTVDDYSMERRLTRTQKTLLAKSANIKASIQSSIPLKKRYNRSEHDDSSEMISPSKNDDAISVKSTRSRRSTTSVKQTGSKKKSEYRDDDDNDDLESTVSSLRSSVSNKGTKKRRSVRGKLNIIPEKDEDNQKPSSDVESNSTVTSNSPRLRTRSKKAN